MTPANRRVGPVRLPADIGAAAGVAGNSAAAAPPNPDPAAPGTRPGSDLAAALRTIAGVALITAASVAVAWSARRCLLGSARFAIASVEVVGNDRRPSGVLAAESGLAVGTNIFAADLDSARSQLLRDAWIVDAALVRRLPGTIVIRVTERRPAALVALDETVLATADGVPFKSLEPGDPVDLPLVTGVTPDAFGTDRDGAAHTISRAIDLAAEYEHSVLAKRAPLQEVHVGADGRFSLIVGHTGMELVLGGPPFRRKIDLASRVVAELERRGGRADAVMLDSESRPDRVVVRMR
jgi:cell division protein FtsQ